jgi:phosphatidylglycerol:prolipoprotein diacylglycerol transferase
VTRLVGQYLETGEVRPRVYQRQCFPSVYTRADIELLAGAIALLRFRRQNTRRMHRHLDAAATAFPFAWILGRTGCFLSRDHPGRFTTSWLGVEYPDGVRYDLGLIEALFTGALIAALPLTRRWPAGVRTGSLLSAYGLFRYLLDRLHTDPPRYSGWTVDEISAVLVFAFGLSICALAVSDRESTSDPPRDKLRFHDCETSNAPRPAPPACDK